MNNRLYRSPDDRVLAGVAGGMAEAYDLDPALVRLAWALLIVFTGGTLLLVYVVMALVVPLRPASGQPVNRGGSMPMSGTPPDQSAMPGESGDSSTEPGVTPLAPPQPAWGLPHQPRRRDASGALVLGVALVLIGAYLFARQLFPLLDLGRFWPILVILIGLVLIVTAFGRRQSP